MAKPFHYDKHKQLCILSVDDDTVNLMVIEQLLMPQGWKVCQCGRRRRRARVALDAAGGPGDPAAQAVNVFFAFNDVSRLSRHKMGWTP